MAEKDTKASEPKEQKTQQDAGEEAEEEQLPLVHAVRSEYYLQPLNNGHSLIPEIQKFTQDMKKASELRKNTK